MNKLHTNILLLAMTLTGFFAYANNIDNQYGKPYMDRPVASPFIQGGDDPLDLKTILESIPTPLEITQIMKETGAVYNKAELNASDASSRYTTQYKQAINLGVYSTDLGYANIYGKNADALSYLSSVRKLAEDLRIAQFFDYETIKALAESSNKINELIQTTAANFDKINNELTNQKREHVSALLLTGGWIESLYLTTVIYKKSKSAVLKEKIGEQAVVLDQLMVVLDLYKSKEGFAELISDLSELRKVYDNIETEEVEVGGGGETLVNGLPQATGGTEVTYKVTDADIDAIASLIKSVRNKIIK